MICQRSAKVLIFLPLAIIDKPPKRRFKESQVIKTVDEEQVLIVDERV